MASFDVTADGLQGFTTTENITANILDDSKTINDLKKKLGNGKSKLSIGLRCSDSFVNTHCISHALYDSSK